MGELASTWNYYGSVTLERLNDTTADEKKYHEELMGGISAEQVSTNLT